MALVDIDGVLNPYAAADCPLGFVEYRLFPSDTDITRLCAAHGDWLKELGTFYELVWVSAWGNVAHELIGSILGVDEFPFVPMPPIPFPPAEKVPAVATYVGNRAVAWIDDALFDEALQWARLPPSAHAPRSGRPGDRTHPGSHRTAA
ncbi:MAG TPA: hypothetical protein VEJ44_01525 [Acidimicrobiales bacterium]|nr:hypothetical protein [Acidimicrobiales bacterium]